MATALIPTRECNACGVSIASNSAFCPYCDTERPEHERIPPEVYNEMLKWITNINGVFTCLILSNRARNLMILSSMYL